MRNILKIFTTFVVVAVMSFVMVACGGGTDDSGDADAVVFEAEGINFEGLSGAGYSNSVNEQGMIQGKDINTELSSSVLNSISNGFFVGYFTTPGTAFEFNINSDADATGCTLILRLSSEFGTIKINPTVMTIEVNGEALAYTEFTITGSKDGGYSVTFKDFTIKEKISLKQGNNVIKLIINVNDYFSGIKTGGPGVDCIKIVSSSNLSWESKWEENYEILKEIRNWD